MNEFLKLIAQNIPRGALVFFNRELDIIFAEGQALQNLSRTISKGKNLAEVFSPAIKNELLPLIQDTLQGEAADIQFQSPENHYHTYWISFKPIQNRQGKTPWGLISMVEVTEVQDIQLRLVNAKFELELKHRALNNMLNILRHDIKSPLASIVNICHLGKMESAQTQTTELFAWIQRIANEALHFTQELLDKKYLPILFEDIFVNIQESLRFHKYIDKVHFDCQVSGGHSYYGNKVQIISLLENLVLNSLNYHDLAKAHPYIHLDIHYKKDGVVLTFEDNGSGIAFQNLPYIFNESYGVKKAQSNGVGLSIVKDIVESLEGTIQVESTPGQGTRFEIYLGAAMQTLAQVESEPLVA